MSQRVPLLNNKPRYILQWGVLVALILFLSGAINFGGGRTDAETYSPMAGLQALVLWLTRGGIPGGMASMQIMMALALTATTVLFGKLFCGYICPVGTVQDLLIKLRKSISLNPIVIPNQCFVDKVLRIFKYLLLFWIIYSSVTLGGYFSRRMDPYYAVATGFSSETVLWMGVVSLVLVVFFGLFIDNFFCRYICPLGAASNTFRFSLWLLVLGGVCYLSSISEVVIPWWTFLAAFCIVGYVFEVVHCKSRQQLLYVHKDNTFCNRCHKCDERCPYDIEISRYNGRVDNIDCTLCGECITACHNKALHIGVLPSTRRNFLNILLPAILAAAVAVAAYFIALDYELPSIDKGRSEVVDAPQPSSAPDTLLKR